MFTPAATTVTSNQNGIQDDCCYELRKDSGNTRISGMFSCQWSSISNALFCKGRKFDSTRTYGQLGNISIDYSCNYQPNGPNGNSIS